MRRFLSTLTAVAIMTSAGIALADTASGTIKSIDAAKHVVTFDNGKQYVADSAVDLSKLKAGEKVTVTYAVKNGTNEASAVKTM